MNSAGDSLMRDTVARSATRRSYDHMYSSLLFAAEDRHFWFRARNLIVAALVHQFCAGKMFGRLILEAGCGTGNVLRVLEGACPHAIIVGMDVSAQSLRYARQRTACALVRGDVRLPPFGRQFDMIALFDVLEHLPDDVQVLQDLNTMLTENGMLLLTVPAHLLLWSTFDEESYHCRRYELDEIRTKLTLAGYRVVYLTQFMASIFPLIWLMRRPRMSICRHLAQDRSRTCEIASELRVPPVINELFVFLLSQEARLIAQRRKLPIGTSLLAMACPLRKRQENNGE